MTERVTNYSKYVKEMYFPKVSKAKNDEIDGIISKLKLNLSDENLGGKLSPADLKKNSSILKLREVQSQLNTPSRALSSAKHGNAVKTLDKYAHAVKSILEKNDENQEERVLNHIDWKAKHNPMKMEKYRPPEPAEFHDNTVQYLNELRTKRKTDGVNMKNK